MAMMGSRVGVGMVVGFLMGGFLYCCRVLGCS